MAKSFVPHDADARNSKKMIRMRQKLGPIEGLAAYGLYWMLIERMRGEEGYTCEKDYEMLDFDFRCGADFIRKVVEEFDLFELSKDGKMIESHGLLERMEIMKVKQAAGRKGAAVRWRERPAGPRQMAQNSKTDGRKDSSYLPEEDALTEEKVEFLRILFFANMKAPNQEYLLFRHYNNTGGRVWDKMPHHERVSAAHLWKQKPPQQPRFSAEDLELWKEFFGALEREGAPLPVRIAALSDDIRLDARGGFLQLTCSSVVQTYVEEHLDSFKPLLMKRIRELGLKGLSYELTDEDEENDGSVV